MAVINYGAGYVTFYIVWTVDIAMSIEGAIAGLVLLLQPITDGNVGKKIYQGIIYTGKIIEKNNQGTWGASWHEESHQFTKDAILKMGGLK